MASARRLARHDGAVMNAAGVVYRGSIDSDAMTKILLVGQDEGLLEGLVQTLAAAGHSVFVALSLADARDLALRELPLMAVIDRRFAAASPSEVLTLSLAAGGALVLFRGAGTMSLALAPALQRAVLADLSLPLERNRLLALAQSLEGRARAAGRAHRDVPPETRPG
jgi:DNA-binding NtrC family response regulator